MASKATSVDSNRASSSLPLAGFRVLDLSTHLPAPLASYLMTLAGAEVIKAERPGGDPSRHMVAGVFDGINLGKRSICLDLRAEEARDVLRRAVASTDVVLMSLRPRARTKLGLSHAELAEIKSDIISCSLVGYRADSSMADIGGHDVNYLGTAGVLALTGGDTGRPGGPIGVALADIAGAWVAFSSLLLALLRRERTGEGDDVEVTLTDASVAFTINRLAEWKATGRLPPSVRPAYGVYETKGGNWISVAALEDVFWASLCKGLGWEDYLTDTSLSTMSQRQDRAAEINNRLQSAFLQSDTAHWISRMAAMDVPVARVNSLEDILTDEYFAQSGLIQVVNGMTAMMYPAIFAGWRPSVPQPAPKIGQHSAEILEEWGFGPGEIGSLLDKGVAQ